MRSIDQSSQVVRFGLALFLSLLLYDGALRKWGPPGGEQVIFVIKDLLLATLLAYALASVGRQSISGVSASEIPSLYVYAVFVFAQMANPSLPNIAVAIWGLKAHVLYMGIVLLLPIAFANLDDLYRVLAKVYPALVIPICAMGFLQLAAPADALINLSIQGDMEATAYFGEADLVRVTGTFSYISGMAAFVQAATLLGFALYLGGERSPWFFAALGAAMASLPSTGSRGVLVATIASILIMLIAAWISRLTKLGGLLRVVVAVIILLAISVVVQEDVWTAMLQRAFGDAGDEHRFYTVFTNAFDYFEVAGLVGFGTGAANLGAVALAGDVVPFSWLPVGGFFEDESGRIVLELGIIGWGISLAMRLALLSIAIRLVFTASTRASRLASVIALPIMAYGVWLGNGVFAVPLANAYFWFCVALLAMAQFESKLNRPQRANSARHPLLPEASS